MVDGLCRLTLFATLVMPLQYAVLMGVGLSVLLFVFHQANRLQLVLIPLQWFSPAEQLKDDKN